MDLLFLSCFVGSDFIAGLACYVACTNKVGVRESKDEMEAYQTLLFIISVLGEAPCALQLFSSRYPRQDNPISGRDEELWALG